jgi:hypothetical protein
MVPADDVTIVAIGRIMPSVRGPRDGRSRPASPVAG